MSVCTYFGSWSKNKTHKSFPDTPRETFVPGTNPTNPRETRAENVKTIVQPSTTKRWPIVSGLVFFSGPTIFGVPSTSLMLQGRVVLVQLQPQPPAHPRPLKSFKGSGFGGFWGENRGEDTLYLQSCGDGTQWKTDPIFDRGELSTFQVRKTA